MIMIIIIMTNVLKQPDQNSETVIPFSFTENSGSTLFKFMNGK